jgi:putative transferase (TIGR04331 family)
VTRNFVVSAETIFWEAGCDTLFAITPYIQHFIEKNGLISNYKDIFIAPCIRRNKVDYEIANAYVTQKTEKYNAIIAERLAEIHGGQYSKQFWSKAFSLSLLRHVSISYDLFEMCEQNLYNDKFCFSVMDKSCFYTPSDFDDHRAYLQHSNFGIEQLFSVYYESIYSKRTGWQAVRKISEIKYVRPQKNPPNQGVFSRLKGKEVSELFLKILKFILITIFRIRLNPVICVLDSYFSDSSIIELLVRSAGGIRFIGHPPKLDVGLQCEDTSKSRTILFEPKDDFDDFDRFIFKTLEWLFPRSYLECFDQNVKFYSSFILQECKGRFIVDEAWIGSEKSALCLAIAGLNGIRHLCNEHNYLSHQFVGNTIPYQTRLSDEFLSIGWDGRGHYNNFVKTGSLFQWKSTTSKRRKDIDLLFILGCVAARSPEVNTAYCDSDSHGSTVYIENTKLFLANLSPSAIRKTYIRGYPKEKISDWQCWDQEWELNQYIKSSRCYDDTSISGKKLISRAHLVVVNYLSTAHLEAILSNIPTVILWNSDSAHLITDYSDFFDDLLKVGVCHKNPVDAARFVNSIIENPMLWWNSQDVRHAVGRFVANNIGDPSSLKSHLLSKCL